MRAAIYDTIQVRGGGGDHVHSGNRDRRIVRA